MIARNFLCMTCGKSEDMPYLSGPQCCSRAMEPGDMRFPACKERQLHLITLLKTPEVDWSMPEQPERVFELWQLRPGGRVNGELIGWIGTRTLSVEWVMAPGIKIRGGFSSTIEEASADMLQAIEGGVFAVRNIQAVVA